VSATESVTAPVDPETVFVEITEMIGVVLDGYELDVDITTETSFFDDLEMESIDLVGLGGQLTERYGGRVNLAELVAGMDVDEIIAITVGQLVDYVVAAHSEVPQP
jgi:acyl carrier protein